jgi:hypothetical protein
MPADLGVSRGVMSIYTNEDDCVSGVVAFDPSASLPESANNRLYAHEGHSLPPPDAMPSEDYENYLPIWQSNCPLLAGGISHGRTEIGKNFAK